MDGPTAMLYKLTVQDLKNFSGLPANVASVMAAHGITAADFATILALDPLASDASRGYVVEYYGYSYSPLQIPAYMPNHTYTRHGKGANYTWADGHDQSLKWLAANRGQNNDQDWYWIMTK